MVTDQQMGKGRAGRFVAGFITGYAMIAVSILYAFFSVRLALQYLGKEEFGLWSLAAQIMGYLMLLEFGVTAAISRLLADHKDDPSGTAYAGLLTAGIYLFGGQGCLVVVIGGCFSQLAPGLFDVPEALRREFANLLLIVTASGGVSLALRFLGTPLWAFNRQDISYGLSILSLTLNLLVLWFGFLLGWGIYSFAAALLPGVLMTPLVTLIVCRQSGYYPQRWTWRVPERGVFKALTVFAKDSFLMNLGNQLVNASQIIILSRFAGLETAATFAVGGKMYALGQQCVVKVIEASAPALTELYVRNVRDQFEKRFWNAVCLSVFLGVLGACVLLLGNASVVKLWSSGVISWSSGLDLLLALLLLAAATTRCLTSLFGIVGNLRPVRFIPFLEGGLFIFLAVPAAMRFGIAGVLVSSLLAHLLVTGSLSLAATKKIFPCLAPIGRPAGGAVLCLITAGCFSAVPFFREASAPTRLLMMPVLMGPIAWIAWKLILAQDLRDELLFRMKAGFSSVFTQVRHLFAA